MLTEKGVIGKHGELVTRGQQRAAGRWNHTMFMILYDRRALDSTRRHELFLNSTCDIRLNDMRHGSKNDSDLRHGYFLNSTCDIGENKRQRHVTLPFCKSSM